MNMKKWFHSKKLWERGGIVGVIVCFVLFLFHILIYFPIVNTIFRDGIPDWALFFPTITGQAFLFFAGFIVPYGFLCNLTVPVCNEWSLFPEPGSVPWTSINGQSGYCAVQTMSPTSACADLSQAVGFVGIAILLVVAYFVIGAVIGKMIEIRKAKRQ